MNTSIVLGLINAGFEFLAVILTVTIAYESKKSNWQHFVRVLFSLGLFLIIYFLIYPHLQKTAPYYGHLAILSVSVYLYGFIYLRRHSINLFIFMVPLLVTSVSVEGILSRFMILCSILDTQTIQGILVFEAFHIFILFLCSLFYALHPLMLPDDTSCKYYTLMAILPILISASYHISTDSIMHAKMPGWQDLTFGILDQCAIILSYSLISLLARSYEALLQTRSINQRLRLQSEQVEHNSQLIEQIRKDKHELKNIFFYIGMLLKEHKYNDLENYVTGTLETRYDRLEEFHTGNNMLDLLLTQKVHEARSYGIRVMANILVPADLPIEGDDLCGLLINLLDNAIDASRKESESEIQINIDQKQSYLCIYVRNRAHADTLKSNPHLHTTKKDEASHGIGLSVIRSIVKKYNGIYQVSMDNGYFETDIMLSMNK